MMAKFEHNTQIKNCSRSKHDLHRKRLKNRMQVTKIGTLTRNYLPAIAAM